jgi:hypothetical protein
MIHPLVQRHTQISQISQKTATAALDDGSHNTGAMDLSSCVRGLQITQ